MNSKTATPLRDYIASEHAGNVTHAAKAIGYDRSTLHRVMQTAYVIGSKLYTPARVKK
jgi:transcriptional regulator of acetoin/glycerol metabolism